MTLLFCCCTVLISFDASYRYHMFVTPLPDPHEAVRRLQEYETAAPWSVSGSCSKLPAHPDPCQRQEEVQEETARPLCLVVLDKSEGSITLAWGRAANSDDFIRRLLDEVDDSSFRSDVGMVDVCVRTSIEHEMSDWLEVYRGRGRGCRVDHLKPDVCYHVRLRTLIHTYDSVDVADLDLDSQRRYCPQGGAVYIKVTPTLYAQTRDAVCQKL